MIKGIAWFTAGCWTKLVAELTAVGLIKAFAWFTAGCWTKFVAEFPDAGLIKGIAWFTAGCWTKFVAEFPDVGLIKWIPWFTAGCWAVFWFISVFVFGGFSNDLNISRSVLWLLVGLLKNAVWFCSDCFLTTKAGRNRFRFWAPFSFSE